MIKNDFNDVYDINYDLFGIVSNIKEYKLAWILNKIFSIDLIKFDDLIITKYNQKTFQVSNYFYETDEFIIRVLKNMIQFLVFLNVQYQEHQQLRKRVTYQFYHSIYLKTQVH